MFKILRFAFVVALGILGLAWKGVQLFMSCAPESVLRIDAPFERSDAEYTWDGRRIID